MCGYGPRKFHESMWEKRTRKSSGDPLLPAQISLMKIIITDNTSILTDEGGVIEKIDASASCIGNIYKARILRRLPQISALSLDIGTKTPAFLPVEDPTLYTPGSDIPVQAVTDAREKRGSRVTEELSVSGFYTVILFGSTRATVGVSKNISDDERRLHLKSLVRRELPNGVGAIVRTEARTADDTAILTELRELLKTHEKIQHDIAFYSAPKLIRDSGAPENAIRRLWSCDVREMVFSSDELMQSIVKDIPESIKETLKISVNEEASDFFDDAPPMRPGDRESIRLPSGGNIVIDKAEALTVIDVNSGECKLKSKEDTVLTVNTEAARAASLALRKNRISGMIVIDFIDMDLDEHRVKTAAALEEACKEDTAKCKLFGFTAMGLFEMTRKPRR